MNSLRIFDRSIIKMEISNTQESELYKYIPPTTYFIEFAVKRIISLITAYAILRY